jgi:tetrahydromethanopterin:alpha-L-glutamate ligase
VKIAVVGQPGRWSTERLAAALRVHGAEAHVVDLAACGLRLPDHRVFYRGQPLTGFSGAVVKKLGDTADGWAVQERINILRQLELSGTPVLSPPDRLGVAVNRYRMTCELTRAGLPVPETTVTEDVDEAAAAVERFGSAVLKPLFTSKGRGMRRLDPSMDLRAALERHRSEGLGPFYLQRFVKHPGRDLGVAVLDGRCLGAYWRVAGEHSWMTTILSGGRYEKAEPPTEAVGLAIRAAEHFGLVFTGVDLIEEPDGRLSVLEVSAFGGFRGLLDGCGTDAALMLAEVALRRLHEASPRR